VLNVAPVLNLALCQTFASFRIVLPLFGAFVFLKSAEMSAAPILELEGVDILAKMMQNGKKKQIFGTAR